MGGADTDSGQGEFARPLELHAQGSKFRLDGIHSFLRHIEQPQILGRGKIDP